MKYIFIILLAASMSTSALMLTGEVESSQTQQVTMPMVRSWRAEIADLATEGSRVEVGDLIARIDGSDLDATIEAQKEALDVYQASSKRDMIQLRIDVNNAELAYEKSKVDYKVASLKAAVPMNFIGELAYKERQLTLKQISKTLADNDKNLVSLKLREKEKQKEIELGLQQKQQQLTYWQEQLANLTINANQGGYVIHATQPMSGSKYQIGDQVRTGEVIVKVSKVTDMQVKTWVNAIDLPKVKDNQPVKVRFDALPGVVLNGQIIVISAGGHDKKNWGSGLYYEITVDLENSDEVDLLPGMSALVYTEEAS